MPRRIAGVRKGGRLAPGLHRRRAKSWPTCTRRSGGAPNELEQLQVIAGLDRDHIERQVAVGLAHARAGR